FATSQRRSCQQASRGVRFFDPKLCGRADPPLSGWQIALINFITNLPRDLRTGGFSAMNVAAYDALSKIETIQYVGPIAPPALYRQKVLSKLLRVAGFQGDFFFYSRKRLANRFRG